MLHPRILSTLRRMAYALCLLLPGYSVHAQGQPAYTFHSFSAFGLYICSGGTTFFDIDADGDLDVMVGGSPTQLIFFENTGTAQAPAYSNKQTSPFGLIGVGGSPYPTAVDLDNDGDYDLLSGTFNGTFTYFENIGTATAPSFAPPVNNPFGLTDIGSRSTPYFCDLDNDGDFDLMAGEYDGDFYYFENTGSASAPGFGPVQASPFGLLDIGMVSAPTLGDVDHDGDLDLFSGEFFSGTQYFENTGTASAPQFAAPLFNAFGLGHGGAQSVANPVDLDDDGDLDIMMTKREGSTFDYYENQDLQPLSATIALVQAISCAGGADGQLQAAFSGGVSPHQFSWSSGDTASLLDALAAGTYTVTITDSLGATDSAQFQLDEPDSVLVTLQTVGLNCATGPGGQATANPVGGTPPYAYLWSTGADSATVPITQPEILAVTVTDANGCQGTDSVDVTCVSIEELVQSRMKLFPNPAADQVHYALDIPSVNPATDMIRVLDAAGRVLVQEPVRAQQGTVNLAGISPGAFVVVISTPGATYHHRLIHQ